MRPYNMLGAALVVYMFLITLFLIVWTQFQFGYITIQITGQPQIDLLAQQLYPECKSNGLEIPLAMFVGVNLGFCFAIVCDDATKKWLYRRLETQKPSKREKKK